MDDRAAGQYLWYDPFKHTGSLPPARPGEYCVYSAKHEICFTGKTDDLRRRMRWHINSGKLKPEGIFEFRRTGEKAAEP